MKFPGFIGPSYVSQAITADQEELYNWYLELMESQAATTDAALYPTPGVSQLSVSIAGPGRAHLYINGREFAVIGATFVEIDSAGTQTSRGTVATDDNPATISSNGDGGGELFVTSGSNGYVFDLASNVLTQIAFLNGKATMGDHLDGYFLALNANTSTLYVSALLDGTTWSSLQFIQRNSAPDKWVAVKVNGPYIWLLGSQTSEVWYDAGTFPMPLAKYPGGLIPHGCAAPFSVAIVGKEIAWLGSSRTGGAYVVSAAGFTPTVISTYPMQSAMEDYTLVSDAQGDSYTDRGHTFYLLSFPRQNVTWAWDSETRLWAKRGTWIAEDNVYIAWRPRWHAFAFNQHRTLDSNAGSLYRMALSIPTDVDSRPIRRMRRAPALEGENERIFYSSFQLDLEPGLGTSTGQGLDPQAMMRQSNDGGKTWGNEQWRSAGKIGNYQWRVIWNRCGAGRRRVFEIAVSDPTPWKLTQAYLTLGQAPSGQARPAA